MLKRIASTGVNLVVLDAQGKVVRDLEAEYRCLDGRDFHLLVDAGQYDRAYREAVIVTRSNPEDPEALQVGNLLHEAEVRSGVRHTRRRVRREALDVDLVEHRVLVPVVRHRSRC